jgi:hypothetical protein
MIMEYTHECDMLLTLGTYTILVILLHGNRVYVILVDVFQTLICFSNCSSVSVRHC